jgi:hypothetical protein
MYGFCMILAVNSDYFLEHREQVDLAMVKCGVLFEVRTELLNIV